MNLTICLLMARRFVEREQIREMVHRLPRPLRRGL